jgi:hypothetical protein
MADTGLRAALQPFSWGTQTLSRGELRLSTDAVVVALPTFFTTVDNANAEFSAGKFALDRIRG